MSLPPTLSRWIEDLDEVRIVSEEDRGELQVVTVEGKIKSFRVVRTCEFETDDGTLFSMSEETEEPPRQSEGRETTDYIDAVRYFEKLFAKVKPLGDIDLPSGYIMVTSPDSFDWEDQEPVEALWRTVPPGRYPLEAAITEEDVMISYRCVFSKERAVSFRNATKKLPGSDIGTMLWIDATHRDAAQANEELRHADTGVHTLENGIAVGITDTAADGGYPLLWGLDENGKIVSLILDVWWDARKENFDLEYTVGDPLPAQLIDAGVVAELEGDEIVLITPYMIDIQTDRNERSSSWNGSQNREKFSPGERLRCVWNGRKLAL